MIRSFLAIELPRTIVNRIEEVQRDLKASRADVRWVNPSQIHLTLKFFGSIEESNIDPIVKSVEGLAQTTRAFTLSTRGMGAFPNLRNPRVIWMGLVDQEGILASLKEGIEVSLEKIGFPPEERAFHPHLTLGRTKSNQGKEGLIGRIEPFKERDFGDFRVEKLILFKSDLRPTGPIYTQLREIRLGS